MSTEQTIRTRQVMPLTIHTAELADGTFEYRFGIEMTPFPGPGVFASTLQEPQDVLKALLSHYNGGSE